LRKHSQKNPKASAPIKTYDFLNPLSPIKTKFPKSTLNTINPEQSDNSFTTIATKRRSDDKTNEPFAFPKSPVVKRTKNELLDLSIKSIPKNITNSYSKNIVAPLIQRTRKKSATKSPISKPQLDLNNSGFFGGATNIYVNQIVVDNQAEKPIEKVIKITNASKVVDDRKFSIMDIPGNLVNIKCKLIIIL
jgi:hypothetical protein